MAAISLDGVLTEPPTDDEDERSDDVFIGLDAVVLGRHTWEAVRTLDPWPYDDVHVVVLTSRPASPAHGEEIATGDLRPVLDGLRARGARTVFLDGLEVIRSAVAADLVDELDVAIVPVLLGEGRRLFEPGERTTRLDLIEWSRGASGTIRARYRVPKARVDRPPRSDLSRVVLVRPIVLAHEAAPASFYRWGESEAFDAAVRRGPSAAGDLVVAALQIAARSEKRDPTDGSSRMTLAEQVVGACFGALAGLHPAAASSVAAMVGDTPGGRIIRGWNPQTPRRGRSGELPEATDDVQAVLEAASRRHRETRELSSVGYSRRAFLQIEGLAQVIGTDDTPAKLAMVDFAASAICDLYPYNKHDSRAADGVQVLLDHVGTQPALAWRYLTFILREDARKGLLELAQGLDGLMLLVVTLGGADAGVAVARAAIELDRRVR